MNCPDCDTEMDDPDGEHTCTPAARHSQAPARRVGNSTMAGKVCPIQCPDCGTEMSDPEGSHHCTPAARHSQAPARLVDNWTMIGKALRRAA